MGIDNEFEINNNIITSDSVSDSDSDSVSDELHGNEENEQSQSEGIDEVDYSDLLTSINGSCSDINAQVEVLNENVIVLNENIKFGISLLFVIVVFLLIKCAYHILGSILGLNKA